MSNREPLVTDFDVTWNDTEAEGFPLNEGEYFERGIAEFENGYAVSFLRTNIDRDGVQPSLGVEEGLWEVVPIRETSNPFLRLQGMEFEPATEFDGNLNHVLEHNGDTFPIGRMTGAELNTLLGVVQAHPKREVPEAEQDLLTALFGGGQE